MQHKSLKLLSFENYFTSFKRKLIDDQLTWFAQKNSLKFNQILSLHSINIEKWLSISFTDVVVSIFWTRLTWFWLRSADCPKYEARVIKNISSKHCSPMLSALAVFIQFIKSNALACKVTVDIWFMIFWCTSRPEPVWVASNVQVYMSSQCWVCLQDEWWCWWCVGGWCGAVVEVCNVCNGCQNMIN